METLRAGFKLGPAGSRRGRAIKDLYGLRDDAVHFESEFYESQPHPTGKSNVSMENVIYSADSAAQAADLGVECRYGMQVSTRERRPHKVVRGRRSCPGLSRREAPCGGWRHPPRADNAVRAPVADAKSLRAGPCPERRLSRTDRRPPGSLSNFARPCRGSRPGPNPPQTAARASARLRFVAASVSESVPCP
jgi:hypothetical protein